MVNNVKTYIRVENGLPMQGAATGARGELGRDQRAPGQP
jgi:hypothetical protein